MSVLDYLSIGGGLFILCLHLWQWKLQDKKGSHIQNTAPEIGGETEEPLDRGHLILDGVCLLTAGLLLLLIITMILNALLRRWDQVGMRLVLFIAASITLKRQINLINS